MIYGICCVPVSPLRAEPSHESEMLSQQIFGECAEIIESLRVGWLKIRCQYAGNVGYCQTGPLAEIDDGLFHTADRDLIIEWVGELEYNGDPMHVPLGSIMTGMKNGYAK